MHRLAPLENTLSKKNRTLPLLSLLLTDLRDRSIRHLYEAIYATQQAIVVADKIL